MQRVLATLGRVDRLTARGGIDALLKSLSRFAALQGVAGKVFQATGIKIPSPVRPRDENVVPKDTCAHITI